MTDLINPDGRPQTDTFERFVALNAGEYWKAKSDISDGFSSNPVDYVSEGEILLINQIDYVDDTAHTIHVRLHPSKISSSHSFRTIQKFLVDDFLANFEFVERSEAEAVRDAELANIQSRIKSEQDEMQSAFSDPLLFDSLVESEMPSETSSEKVNLPVKLETFDADIVGAVKTQNLTALMSKGLTAQGVEQIKSGLEDQKKLAVKRNDWIKMRTNRLTKISSEMTPFFEEKAAMALAMTSEMRKHVEDLMKGIGNLNLYVLKDVSIETLKEGVSAPEDIKLSVAQRVLYMDEEMAVWEDVGESFDSRNIDKFISALTKNQGLVEQIFPTERSVVSVAPTRKYHSYEGYNANYAANLDRENKRQFLLVRDGSNLHMVLSPELFHNFAPTLFPTTDATEAPFKGMDGKNITYRDLDYTRSLEKHERIALGYKRLLILLCGLDHNKGLFGQFYEGEPSLDFVSLSFQEKYFNFIHDVGGEGLIATHRPETVKDWAKELNSEITVGSRIIMQWREVLNVENCPSAFERENRWNTSRDSERRMQYSPTVIGDTLVGEVYRKNGELAVNIEVSGEKITSYEKRTFNATLNLSMALSYANKFDILCVDRLNPKEALWYLHDRPSRTLNVSGIRMLKAAINLAKKYRKEESELRAMLSEAMIASGQFKEDDDVERLMDMAIAKWRCANPKKSIDVILQDKSSFNALCDQVFFLGDKGRDIKEEIRLSEEKLGRTLIRLSLMANGKYAAYSTPLAEERDDRVFKFTWVAKSTYNLLKKSVSVARVTFVHLNDINNAETVIYEIDDISPYLPPKNVPFKKLSEKKKKFETLSQGYSDFQKILAMKDDADAVQDLIDEFDSRRDHLTYYSSKSKKGVVSPKYAFPLALSVSRKSPVFVGFSGDMSEVMAWLISHHPSLEASFIEMYGEIYKESEKSIARIRDLILKAKGKSFVEFVGIDSFIDFDIKKVGYMLDDEVDAYMHGVSAVKGHSYSMTKRIEKLVGNGVSYCLADDEMISLDAYFGLEAPVEHRPTLVQVKNDFGNKEVNLFDYTLDASKSIHGQVYDTMEEAESAHKHASYISLKDGKSFKVVAEWVEVAPREFRGVKAIKSYEYKEISREQVDSIFD